MANFDLLSRFNDKILLRFIDGGEIVYFIKQKSYLLLIQDWNGDNHLNFQSLILVQYISPFQNQKWWYNLDKSKIISKGQVRDRYELCEKTNLLTAAANWEPLPTILKFVSAANQLKPLRIKARHCHRFFHQNMSTRLGAIKRQENNGASSFSLSMTSENHRFFTFMPLSLGH